MLQTSKLSVIIALVLLPIFNQAQSIKVTLLGTGTPEPSIERFGPSTLVEANGKYFLFDCGRGVSQRLWQKGIKLGEVNNLFITHHHSDHVVGIPDLWLTGWLPPNFGQRKSPMKVYGPEGTNLMMESLKQTFQGDINRRKKNLNNDGILVISKDIEEGIVLNEEGIKITAFWVEHGKFPALGYRLDYLGHSVVISGDTKYSENLIKFARDTDVLIHEVALARPELIEKSKRARAILSSHTSPEDGGRIFSQVNPKLAVFTHIILLSMDTTISPPTIDDIIPRTQVNYKGSIELGEDLMTIEIGEKITVQRFSKD